MLAVTNDATPTITGTGEVGATVTVVADVDLDGSGSTETEIGQTVVDGDGNWSITSSATLPEGTIALSATQVDEAGTTSAAFAASIKIDITANAPTIDVLAVTKNQLPPITGTGEVGATVTLLADTDADGTGADVQIGQTVVDGDGNWSITSSATLSEGTIALSATQTDEAGNTSAASAAASIEIDLTANASND